MDKKSGIKYILMREEWCQFMTLVQSPPLRWNVSYTWNGIVSFPPCINAATKAYAIQQHVHDKCSICIINPQIGMIIKGWYFERW